MLSAYEIKVIKRHYFYPVIASISLCVGLGLGFVMVLLEAIDDLAFKSPLLGIGAGFYAYLVIAVVAIAAFSYCTLALRLGKKNRQTWASLVARAEVVERHLDKSAQVVGGIGLMTVGDALSDSDNNDLAALGYAAEVAGAVTTGAAVVQMGMAEHGNACRVADAFGLKLPSVNGLVFALIFVPLAIVVGLYVPRYMEDVRINNERAAQAATAIDALRGAFEGGCERVSCDDPLKEVEDNYGFAAYLREDSDADSTQKGVYVTISLDEVGVVENIHYVARIDIDKTPEENLDQARVDFASLHEMFVKADVELENEGIRTAPEFTSDFSEKFAAGGYYDEFTLYTHNDGWTVGETFNTDKEEDFDKYTRPSIWWSAYSK